VLRTLGRMGVESRTRLEYVMGTPELRKTYLCAVEACALSQGEGAHAWERMGSHIERNPPERQWTTSKWRPR